MNTMFGKPITYRFFTYLIHQSNCWIRSVVLKWNKNLAFSYLHKSLLNTAQTSWRRRDVTQQRKIHCYELNDITSRRAAEGNSCVLTDYTFLKCWRSARQQMPWTCWMLSWISSPGIPVVEAYCCNTCNSISGFVVQWLKCWICNPDGVLIKSIPLFSDQCFLYFFIMA
jgi:hypothetical protein